MDGNGCYFVSAANNACAASKTCVAPRVVATGMACGCPADGVKLGTGCGNRNLDDTGADAVNDAVLRCETSGTCQIWKVLSDCGADKLTAGTVNGVNSCVCKPPSANTLYVDPAPVPSARMTGAPTGTQFPAACRLSSLKSALAKISVGAGTNQIVAIHEATPVHLGAATGESFPLNIPSGTIVTTADGPNPDPSHFVIDIGGVPSTQSAVLLGAGSVMKGFTLDAGGATGSPSAGANVSNVVTCADTTTAQTATLDHVIIKSRSAQTGVLVRGACAFVANQIGIYGALIGVDVTRTSPGADDIAALTAADVTVNSSAASSIGVRVGTGLNSGARSVLKITGAIIATHDFGIVVAGGAANISAAAISFTGTNVGPQNRGIVVSGGSVTFDGGAVRGGDASGSGNAIGAEITAGTTVLSGTAIAGGSHFTGLQISGASSVTLTGTSLGPAKLTTTLSPTALDSSDGVVVLSGATASHLTIDGSTEVSGFHNGVVVNDGSFAVQGMGVAIFANRNDGMEILNRNSPIAPAATLSVSGAAIRDNTAKGLVVRTIVPLTATNCTITGNGSDGVEAQRTQTTAQTGMPQFVLGGSTVSGNAGRGVALTGQGVGTGILSGGKVGVSLTGNTISSNGGVGVFVTEAPDNADGDDVTEAWLDDNDIGGNLSGPAVPAATRAGGILFASSDNNTRILLHTFLGNRVHGNGRSEIGFNLVQNDASPWNLSSDATGQSGLCATAARPNLVYCYDIFPGDLAIDVASSAVHVNIKGMHFQNTPAAAGRDYSTTISSSEITAFCSAQACQ